MQVTQRSWKGSVIHRSIGGTSIEDRIPKALKTAKTKIPSSGLAKPGPPCMSRLSPYSVGLVLVLLSVSKKQLLY